MLDKPKFLSGEVTEFIETNYGTKYVDSPNCFYRWDVREFYIQPFHKDMVEYFTEIENQISIAKLGVNYYNIYSDMTYCFPLPVTLAHFISDCIRAGIKLKWKN